MSKSRKFFLRLKILSEYPIECIYLYNVTQRMTVSFLKTVIEQDVGILPEMYTLTYLDACPLVDETTLFDNFIVSGSTIILRPWRTWHDLLYYAYTGKGEKCLRTMDITGLTDWNRYCAWVALYISSHCGHYHLVLSILVNTKVAVNLKSPCSQWTALHAAARKGRWKALCILIDKGADVTFKDVNDNTAFDLARKYSNKKCENSLNFCQWNLQKHYIVQERKKDYDANNSRRASQRQSHLTYDSTLSTWFRGQQGQLYMSELPNSVAIKHIKEYNNEVLKKKSLLPQISKEPAEEGGKFDFNYGWFDTLRAQKLIPSSHDIVTYADPSSCTLRPRSLLNPTGYTKTKIK